MNPRKHPAPMVGLGDKVALVILKVGIKPCNGCKQRQQQLNDWWIGLIDKLTKVFSG
ncbi:MAG: hypothetical protein WC773_04620 [Patescibacteria group bacterium]